VDGNNLHEIRNAGRGGRVRRIEGKDLDEVLRNKNLKTAVDQDGCGPTSWESRGSDLPHERGESRWGKALRTVGAFLTAQRVPPRNPQTHCEGARGNLITRIELVGYGQIMLAVRLLRSSASTHLTPPLLANSTTQRAS